VKSGQSVTQNGQIDTQDGHFGRVSASGIELAFYRVKTFKSDLLKQTDYCKAATTPTDRKQRKIV
jgi:hypothetical protein